MAVLTRYENLSPTALRVIGAVEEVRAFLTPARGDPAVRFCLYAQGRTGSTLLTSLLDSHPDITCPDEILRRPKVAPRTYLTRRARQATTRAFGFHVKCYQLERFAGVTEQGAFLDALEADGWRLLHLRREDLFAHAFSNAFAREIRRYHMTEVQAPSTAPRIGVDPSRIVTNIEKRLRWGAMERDALTGRDLFEIVYERDLLDPDARGAILPKVLEWLGLRSDVSLATPLRKSVSRPPWEMIANGAEVRRAMEGAGLGHLVPEG
ncbi:MAG: hypothetical protein AAF366_20415 [Pseudomonadota bacterium]